MTREKVKEVACIYIDRLRNITGKEAPKIARIGKEDWPDLVCTQHIAWMCNKVLDFVDEDRVEKAFCWLGFIQGILWQNGFYSIDELANHNRPTGEDYVDD